MYPNLFYAFKALFHIEIRAFKLINTFGFFVIWSFALGGVALYLELKRKARQGLMSYTEKKILTHPPTRPIDYVINTCFGFLLGYKIVGAYLNINEIETPQEYILSTQGNFIAGFVVACGFVYLKWRDAKKHKKYKSHQKLVRLWPHNRMMDFIFRAFVFGFLGAKIFNSLENIDVFLKNPIDDLLSFSGLTFYGGLICATIAIWVFCLRNNISPIHFADAIAPAMMLSYGIGRLACYFSGDGDWGIVNTLSKPFILIPDWFWKSTFPHNVINEGVPIAGCVGKYCNVLPAAVFPTSLYEAIVCTGLFFLLWSIRKNIHVAGRITAIYLMLNGAERFLVEQIRVNTKYAFLPFQPTQAELIAVVCILAGAGLYWYAPKLKIKTAQPQYLKN